jgi:Uma2 family endonuclease
MGDPARRRATYDDILSLPEHVVGELLGGELVVSPRPGGPHTRSASVLGIKVGGPFGLGEGGPGGWWILDEPELHLGEDVMVPDLAGWRRERMPRVPREAFFTLVPDWICEVLSSSTARLDRKHKLPRYAAAGVRHAWLVDPELRTLEVLERSDRGWTIVAVHAGNERVRAVPFDAVELPLDLLWDDVEVDAGGPSS